MFLGTIAMGAEDVDRAVKFWAEALGYDIVDAWEGSPNQWTILRPPSGEGTRVAIHRSETPPQEHPRVHLDLVSETTEEQEGEIARLVGLGATKVPWDYNADADFVVLADTEGNRFCIVDASFEQSNDA